MTLALGNRADLDHGTKQNLRWTLSEHSFEQKVVKVVVVEHEGLQKKHYEGNLFGPGIHQVSLARVVAEKVRGDHNLMQLNKMTDSSEDHDNHFEGRTAAQKVGDEALHTEGVGVMEHQDHILASVGVQRNDPEEGHDMGQDAVLEWSQTVLRNHAGELPEELLVPG
jgi:hypothetical protein